MKFAELLAKPHEISGEVITDKFESTHSFEWGGEGGYEFTEYGREYFNKILNSEVEIIARNRLVVKLLNPEITEEEYNEFMELVAGYVPQSFFDKCLKEVV